MYVCAFDPVCRLSYLEQNWSHGTNHGLTASMVRTSFLKSVRHMQDLGSLTKGVRVFHVAEPHGAEDAAEGVPAADQGSDVDAYTPPDAPHTQVC